MSRLAMQSSAAVATGTSARSEEDAENICPVCKSSRYLNPNMKFLVNPECYHKMCESCVERIFSHGPAQCPVAGCRKTLRKHRFRNQTFQDVQVEREVDIRRRVADVFNRREDDFDTLRDYNNYLEEVEDLTFNLIMGIDVAENERKLANYKEQHAKDIKANAMLAKDESASMQARQAAAREQERLRRQAALREMEAERKEKEEGRRHLLNQLATGRGDANKIVRDEERVMLKRSSARRTEVDRLGAPAAPRSSANVAAGATGAATGAAATDKSNDTFVIRGLKKRIEPEPEKPYDPFGGLELTHKYFVMQDRYEWDWLNEARTNPAYTAGGYNVEEYTSRALVEAFSGLGVFVHEEMAAKEAKNPTQFDVVSASRAADAGVAKESKNNKIIATGAAESDDVF